LRAPKFTAGLGARGVRILVVGGTGFIGKHVTRYLGTMGHDVGVFHRGSREGGLPEGIVHIHGTYPDYRSHDRAFREFAPDVVVQMVLPQGNDRTAGEFTKAFRGIAGRSVVTSSRDVYRAFSRLHRLEQGPPDPTPLVEASPLRERLFPYREISDDPAWHDYDDILVERTVMAEPSLPGTILRIPVVYGPGDSNFHRTFPYLRRMDDGRPFILVDAQRSNWRDSRVYVEDVAWAIALAASDERAGGRIYNLAPSRTLTEQEWIEDIARVVGWAGEIATIPREKLPKHLARDLDFRNDLDLSSRRIRTELGYSEQVPFELGLRRTIEWQRGNEPGAGFRPFDYDAEDASYKASGGSGPTGNPM
jgi:nucleoside-diphosphate-sugar epimerase